MSYNGMHLTLQIPGGQAGTASAQALALLGTITASSCIPPVDVTTELRTPRRSPQAT
jgi:hypothetical protein